MSIVDSWVKIMACMFLRTSCKIPMNLTEQPTSPLGVKHFCLFGKEHQLVQLPAFRFGLVAP